MPSSRSKTRKSALDDQKEAFLQEVEKRQQVDNESKGIQTSLVDIKAETDAIKQDMKGWQKDYVSVLAELEKKMDDSQDEIKGLENNLMALNIPELKENINSLKADIEKITHPPDNSLPDTPPAPEKKIERTQSGSELRIKMKINPKDFQVMEGQQVELKKHPTIIKPFYKSKDQYKEILERHIEELSEMQNILYADNRYALLLIFQAMDAAGKDGAIKHVMSGVNPQGCQVFSFKHPSPEELDHDFLWRTTRDLPQRGRSAYLTVLIMKKY